MADAELLPTWLFNTMDLNGDVISGAKLNTYEVGTTTPQATFLDSALTSPAANPILTDAAGRFPDAIFAQALQYKFVLTDASDNTLQTVEPWTPVTFRLATQFGFEYFSVYNDGTNSDAQDIYDLVIPDGTTLALPAGATNSKAVAATAATAETTYTMFKNGGSVGTIVFAAAGTTGVFTVATEVSFAPGDVFEIRNQATADGTLSDISVTIAFSRE